MPDHNPCPNKPFENWTSVAQECKSLLRTGQAGEAETTGKVELEKTPDKRDLHQTKHSALLYLENHVKKPR